MAHVDVRQRIQASAAEVYAVAQDYAARSSWDPFTLHQRFLTTGALVRVGSQVEITDRRGIAMVVEFIVVKPGDRAAIRMVSGPWWLRSFAGTWAFKPVDARTCDAVFRYSFSPRVPGTGPVLAWSFRRSTKARLLALKARCESPAIREN